MPDTDAPYDAVVIGGGFYGSAIAIHLARERGLARIALVERESAPLRRASHNNQARVHNGYHYPRSFTTAYRSRINLPGFVRDWPRAVRQDGHKLYAIARNNSKVTARQFVRFCKDIGAKIEPADQALRQMFEPRLIEDVFLVEEYAFDASRLTQQVEEDFQRHEIQTFFNCRVTAVSKDGGGLVISAVSAGTVERKFECRHAFNCTYSGLNQLGGEFPGTRTGLKHEIAEMALLRVPPALADLGVTVMDGPFFSMMPFPSRELHTLSHVRYTPHLSWPDQAGIDPYRRLDEYPRASRVDRMLRDTRRYMPAILDADYVESLFEVKTVLAKNENDDGRPILFERHADLPGLYSVLGGKLDNIFDVFEKLKGLALE
jgi:glycine/D-amino acid oxidase-like deaminating enzyme